MPLFKNIFEHAGTEKLNFLQVAKIRKDRMDREGYDTRFINWDHYVKVLEAKHKSLKNS